jgi:imidazolonepropionase-like amidohydrolase
MSRRLTICLFGILALAACVRGGGPGGIADQSSPTLAIVGVTVIPMTEGATTLPDHVVLVRDDRIAAVGPRRRVAIPRSARIIDARGRFLMPGLADAHVHLEYIEDPNVLKLFVANGVTTVRSMDGRPYIMGWRDRVRSGSLVGPRIVTAGPIIDGAPPARPDNLAVADAAAARAAVAEQAAGGYDFIKLCSNLSEGAYEAAIAEARQRGLRVAGHVPRAVALERAAASLWSIEHLGDFAAGIAAPGSTTPGWARRALAAPTDQAKLGALASTLAAAGTWVVPTTVQQDRWLAPQAKVAAWLSDPQISSLPPFILDFWRGSVERMSSRMDADDWAMLERARVNRLAAVAALHRAGVKLAIGTDTPNPFVAMGASVHLELANFVAAGMTPLEALRAATVAPARMLGLEAEQGSVEIGKRADLLILEGNPLQDIGETTRPFGLVLAGRWFSAEELSALRSAMRPASANPTAAAGRPPGG